MSDIITSGASVIEPTLILGYSSTRAARTIIHDIIGRAAPDVTLRPAGLRSGRMELAFLTDDSESASAAAEAVLATAATFSLVSSDRASVSLQFVVPAGTNITRTLDDETRDGWVVAFGWQEVIP